MRYTYGAHLRNLPIPNADSLLLHMELLGRQSLLVWQLPLGSAPSRNRFAEGCLLLNVFQWSQMLNLMPFRYGRKGRRKSITTDASFECLHFIVVLFDLFFFSTFKPGNDSFKTIFKLNILELDSVQLVFFFLKNTDFESYFRRSETLFSLSDPGIQLRSRQFERRLLGFDLSFLN